MRHGVPRIHHQVHQNLVHLPGVGHHLSQVRTEPGNQLDVLADQPLQHLFRFSHHQIQIQRLGLHQLLPAEGQEFLGQFRGALSRLQNLFQPGLGSIAVRQFAQEHLAVAVDHRQQIVEIVRHAAGQPPDALHLLRLQVLRLDPFALRDVAQRRLGPDDPPVLFDLRDQRLDPDTASRRSECLRIRIGRARFHRASGGRGGRAVPPAIPGQRNAPRTTSRMSASCSPNHSRKRRLANTSRPSTSSMMMASLTFSTSR